MTIQNQEHIQLTTLANLLHSLSDSTRLAIIRRLIESEARVADLVEQLGLAQSTISAHMSCLKECRIIEGRAEGRQTFYRLASPEVAHLLHDAEKILEQTDQAVDNCRVFGARHEC